MTQKPHRIVALILGIAGIVLMLLSFTSVHAQVVPLDVWVNTNTPVPSMTQRVPSKAIQITGLTTGLCLTLDSNSVLTTTTCGSVGGGFNFTSLSNYGVNTSATTTPLWAENGIFASTTSHFVKADFSEATSTSFFATLASTTSFFGSNLSSCTGSNALQWTGGKFSCAAVSTGSTASTTLFSDQNTWSSSGFNAFANLTFANATGTTLAISGSSTISGVFNAVNGANITKISNLTNNGFVKTSGGNGALSIDTTTYVSSVAGTANQVTSSGGATPTLSLPNHVIFPGNFQATNATTTNATTTSLAVTGSTTVGSIFQGGGLSVCQTTSALTYDGTKFTCTSQPQGTVTSVSGTANQITSSGGATPTLTLPNHVIFPGNFQVTNSTTTNATTTSFAVLGSTTVGTTFNGAGLTSCNSASNALTWNAGVFGCNTITSSGGGFDFTPLSNYAVNTSATTTPLWAKNGVFASSTIAQPNTFDYLTVTTGATTSALMVGNPLGADDSGINFGSTTANGWSVGAASSTASGFANDFVIASSSNLYTKQALLIDKNLDTYLGTSTDSVNATNLARLTIDNGLSTSENIINAYANVNDFAQIQCQNFNVGANAECGFSATRSDGTATTGFNYVGVNNPGFTRQGAAYVGSAGDATILALANDLHIAQGTSGRRLYVHNGGTATSSIAMTFDSTGGNNRVGIGTTTPYAMFAIQAPATSTLTTLFVIASSSSSTSTLFSISNTGSSTIGGASAASGLTVLGAATTTFGAYIGGTLSAANFIDRGAVGSACLGESGGLIGDNTNCVSSIASANGSLTVSSPTGSVDLSLALGHSNAWTSLQSFGANASTTQLSVFNGLYVGTNNTATSTIQGATNGTSTLQGFLNVAGTNSTSTFSGGLAATYLNLTGSSATSTASNGLNITAGCFAIAGTCLSSGSGGAVLDYQVFTSGTTNWTKPASATGNELVIVMAWGGGGGGGGMTTGASRGGAGGGGGTGVFKIFKASDLTSTVSVTVGGGGGGGASGANIGTVGSDSTFGSFLTAYGGGGGGSNSASGSGGGGGGLKADGTSGTGGTAAGGAGGGPNNTFGAGGTSGGGNGGDSSSGGGGGGGSQTSAGAEGNGGNSTFGGGGGSGGTGAASGVGGSSYWGGGGGGTSAGGTSVMGGAGGVGNAGAGSIPGGGGGGPTSGNSAGGNGARGEVRVWTL